MCWKQLFVVLIVVVCLGYVSCDTPANCTFDDIQGEWLFVEGERESDSSLNCSQFNGPVAHTLKLRLQFPNIAVDESGNKGYWTIVYNQGFEVIINYRKYFAFSSYEPDSSGNAISYCDRTIPGWSHDVLGKNWACYSGQKVRPKMSPKFNERSFLGRSVPFHSNAHVNFINEVQSSWRAAVYPELETMSNSDLIKRAGGLKSRLHRPPAVAPVPPKLAKVFSDLPREFDWRNVDGINYVSPVRDQGKCGSCYAFSSLAMLESRLRIMTNNSAKVQFSPQDIVSCSEYSQGCDGGFPYVIAGKYAQDFGVLPEGCFPYVGRDGTCAPRNCKRYYVARYKYVGGFFGGCNEELMKQDLVHNGPLTVAFEVYPDLHNYHSGIYHHTGIGARYNPFNLVNHGVLIVGYGVSNGEKFWIVKNSWGESWGEHGYFRIRRGTNECSIESMAVSAIPIP